MITGSNLSLKKQDLENQKIQSIGYVKLVAATKANAGDTSINLTSLTLPSELSSNGFSNPPTAQLTAANLLFYRNNLTVISSVRGLLQPYHSYRVSSSTLITFIGFTALANEIFTVQIDYTSSTGLKVVDARPIVATGTVAINTTDFNVGTPFKINQYTNAQVGGVLVFVDGVLQARNTGNSSTVLDGNYWEVDAGGGLGTIIRLNTTDPVNVRNVMVTSNGLLSERPDGSMMAVIENTQGQLNNMATYVAALAGQSVNTVLGASPSGVDLKNFGDRVFSLEQNRARIDLSNTWTANQQLPGRTDGAAIASGYIGETITSTLSSTSLAAPNTDQDISGASLALPAGRWQIFYSVEYSYDTTATTATGDGGSVFCKVTNASNTLVAKTISAAFHRTNGTNQTFYTTTLAKSVVVDISATTTYKLRGQYTDNSGTNACTFCLQGSDYNSFYAVRIA
jgi:hypothetical protein